MTEAQNRWILIRRSENGTDDPETLGHFGTFEAARLEAALTMCDLTTGGTDITVERNGDSETVLRASGTPEVLVVRRDADG